MKHSFNQTIITLGLKKEVEEQVQECEVIGGCSTMFSLGLRS